MMTVLMAAVRTMFGPRTGVRTVASPSGALSRVCLAFSSSCSGALMSPRPRPAQPADSATSPTTLAEATPEDATTAAVEAQIYSLRARGAEWVTTAVAKGKLDPPTQGQPLEPLYSCPGPNPLGLREVKQLDTHLLEPQQLLRMCDEGVTLFEPFGGLAAGAEMLLRNGVPIRRYMYADICASARNIARHRLALLSDRYGPRLFPATAWARAFTTLPQDIYRVSPQILEAAGALDGTQWMVVAGWECQDLSPAGSGKGLRGKKSKSFFPLVRVLGYLQQLQAARPPAFLLENTAMKLPYHNQGEQVANDFKYICETIGPCVELDAARVGSFAHRLRDYWTNLACTQQMQAVLDLVERDPKLQLQDILGPGRQPQLCFRQRNPPWYPASRLNEPLQVMPTLVSCTLPSAGEGSRVWESESGALVPMTPEEREMALGYRAGDTAALGATAEKRHVVTGACMDANAMQSLLAVALALRLPQQAGGRGPGSRAVAAGGRADAQADPPRQAAAAAVTKPARKAAGSIPLLGQAAPKYALPPHLRGKPGARAQLGAVQLRRNGSALRSLRG